MQAIARDRETLDALCLRVLGRTAGVVEATLALNPGLAAQGAQLTAGTAVQLADLPETPTLPTVNLWD
ncbi:tail protein X [Acidovorax sp. SUPP1855]|uniref:tail protein X n=1 Tax=Acidovorax sp. SUPP1855 TaxID=431774 RepID=UPI0023DE3150|nr:tail protein X [Acidovorax sp. SUPP1855]GKS83206.1 tail protein X [Acidovorax sp. SUPP1855]